MAHDGGVATVADGGTNESWQSGGKGVGAAKRGTLNCADRHSHPSRLLSPSERYALRHRPAGMQWRRWRLVARRLVQRRSDGACHCAGCAADQGADPHGLPAAAGAPECGARQFPLSAARRG